MATDKKGRPRQKSTSRTRAVFYAYVFKGAAYERPFQREPSKGDQQSVLEILPPQTASRRTLQRAPCKDIRKRTGHNACLGGP